MCAPSSRAAALSISIAGQAEGSIAQILSSPPASSPGVAVAVGAAAGSSLGVSVASRSIGLLSFLSGLSALPASALVAFGCATAVAGIASSAAATRSPTRAWFIAIPSAVLPTRASDRIIASAGPGPCRQTPLVIAAD